MTIARQLYDIFFASSTHYAVAKVNSRGGLAYYPEEGIPSLEMIEQHMRGELVLGAYSLLPGNLVRWMAFDVDASDLARAKEIAKKLCEFLGGIRYRVEYSGNKGYHILIFFDRAVLAADAKRIGEHIRDGLGLPKSGDPHVEVYPKQAAITETNPLGSLLRLPLGFHPLTHNRCFFVDTDNGWEHGPEQTPEKLLDWRMGIAEMERKLTSRDPYEQTKSLLLPYWTGGQRHDMALWVSAHLASLGWTEESVNDLVAELTEEIGEGDVDNLKDCVHDTFAKVYRNEPVRGFDGLSTVMTSKTLQDLTTAASKETFSSSLQIIDRHRLSKGAQFQKVRICAKTILSHLKETGFIIEDRSVVYWMADSSRDLLILGGAEWQRYMHTSFGLNPIDSFGKQVLESVRLYAEEAAQKVAVYKFYHWDRIREKLYINGGGAEVYVINGDWQTVEVILNGDEDVFFLNTESSLNLGNLLHEELAPLSPWEVLTDDLSFADKSENVLATPTQQVQLLKAWFVSLFFNEIMPTKPILAFLAESGAGKSTAARRFLQMLEGPDEDVTGVVPDKPDAFRSSVMAHRLLVLDNLEKTKAHWLTDVLNRVSTGAQIEVRTLYKTNQLTKLVPNCSIVITATSMPFSEETVYTRMLPIELKKLPKTVSESVMQIKMHTQYASFWRGLLMCLNEVVAELKRVKSAEAPNESRLADFTVFCARIQDAPFLDGKELMDGLMSMVSRQRQKLRESSPFVQVLEVWLKQRPDEAKEWHPMSDLFAVLKRVATSYRMEWRWANAQGLARHVNALEKELCQQCGMTTRSVRRNGQEIKEYKFVRALIETE